MARNPVIQVPCSDSLYRKLEDERAKSDGKSLAEVGRELWEFALMIKERSEASEAKTNRELMEEQLLMHYKNEALIKQLLIQVYVPGKPIDNSTLDALRELVTQQGKKAEGKFDEFMASTD